MILLPVTVIHTDIYNRREPSPVFRRKAPFIKPGILYRVRVERREKPQQMVHMIDRISIQQIQILIGPAPTNRKENGNVNDATAGNGNGVMDDAVDDVTDGVEDVTDGITDGIDRAADDLTEDNGVQNNQENTDQTGKKTDRAMEENR